MLITDATLPDGRCRDIRVSGERIAAVDSSLSPMDDELHIDAAGYRLFPGAIDVHVHFREPGASHKETWETGSKAAAAGGVTTVVDQPNTDPPTVTGDDVDAKTTLAAASLVDYGINGGVTAAWDPDSLFDRPLVALGEIFLADSTGEMGIDQELFAAAVANAAAHDCPVTVHAEDATAFDASALAGDHGGPGRQADADAWSQYRRPEAELTAVETALDVATDTGAQLHIAHTSTPEAIDRVAETEATCEVTPHHALLSRADLDELGTYGRMNPPLRSKRRQEAVFERLVDGTVDMVATDHAPHTRAEKDQPLTAAPSGVPGVETMLPLLLWHARTGALSYARVRELTATTPAAVFGFPSKGKIAPGYDADLVLVDPEQDREIRSADLHSKCQWTPFAGHRGIFPLFTMVRGQLVYAAPTAPLPTSVADQLTPFGPPAGRNVRSAEGKVP